MHLGPVAYLRQIIIHTCSVKHLLNMYIVYFKQKNNCYLEIRC